MSPQKLFLINSSQRLERVLLFLLGLSFVSLFFLRHLWDTWTIVLYSYLSLTLLFLKVLSLALSKKPFPLPSISKLFVLFLVLFSISSLNSSFPKEARLYSIHLFNLVTFFLIVRQLKDSSKLILRKTICVSISVFALFFIAAKFDRFIAESMDEFFLKSNFVGSVTLLGLFYSLDIYKSSRAIALPSLFLCAAAWIIAGSIAGLLGILTAGSLFLYKKKRRGAILLCAAMIIGTLFFVKKSSFTDRARWWSAAVQMTLRSPVWGLGAGSYEKVAPDHWDRGLRSPFAHNFFLQMAAELGIAASLVFLILFLNQLRRIDSAVIQAGLLAILIQNCFDYSLNVPGFLLLVWSSIALWQQPEKTAMVSHGF
ncbi:MAG: O-antigen ligase family protein [Elusimicrobia bacterium]|nr:O-antigen ligase family protein [Elusimicrobiota bacterium]